jgi:xylose isomerase
MDTNQTSGLNARTQNLEKLKQQRIDRAKRLVHVPFKYVQAKEVNFETMHEAKLPPEVEELKKSVNNKEAQKTVQDYHEKVEQRCKECSNVRNEVPKLQIDLLRFQEGNAGGDQNKQKDKFNIRKY